MYTVQQIIFDDVILQILQALSKVCLDEIDYQSCMIFKPNWFLEIAFVRNVSYK